MIHRVNLNLLRSLKVLLEERHVSHAADKLNLTQSAVSRQLSQLRRLFADPLLIREGNTLIPTPKALQLQAKLANWFLELDDMLEEKEFDPAKWHGEFVLSSSDYVAQYILAARFIASACHLRYSAGIQHVSDSTRRRVFCSNR